MPTSRHGAQTLGFAVILSVSYELLDQNCPESWKQRQFDGSPALTGWSPPSTLLSPANATAMAWLQDVMLDFAAIAADAGQAVRMQIGELGGGSGRIESPASTTLPRLQLMAAPRRDRGCERGPDGGGGQLSRLVPPRCSALRRWRCATPSGRRILTPTFCCCFTRLRSLGSAAIRRLNLPEAWVYPAFDVLQLEDYDYVTGGDIAGSRRAADAVTADLGYPAADQHYFSGFVLDAAHRDQWAPRWRQASARREARGVARGFVWALPQVLRDGFTWFDSGDDMQPFHDVRFPLEVGLGASGGPEFSTTIVTSVSGAEQRNSAWSQARMKYDAGLGVRSEADLATIAAFFRARRGAAIGFRFRDRGDFSSNGTSATPTPLDQALGIGDGAATRFALVKRYGDGDDAHLRRISRPEVESVRVAVGGVEQASGWTLGRWRRDRLRCGASGGGHRRVPFRRAGSLCRRPAGNLRRVLCGGRNTERAAGRNPRKSRAVETR